MRTRRSPRNQEILWRELSGTEPPRKQERRIYTDDEIDAMPFLSKSSRSAMKREMQGLRIKRAGSHTHRSET